MSIEAHILNWNEMDILPFTIKHYQKFCSSITIYDNYSDDGSPEYAEKMGCIVKQFGNPGELDDSEYLRVKNNCWKGSRAEYVIVCDADEILTGLTTDDNKLYKLQDSNILPSIYKTQGWQIISNDMPKQDLLEITNGWAFNNYSKNIMFDPKRIEEINYNPGAHKIFPVGDVVYSEETLYLFHYRQIGGVQRLINRYAKYKARFSPHNQRTGHGCHYKKSRSKIISDWNEEIKKAKPLIGNA